MFLEYLKPFKVNPDRVDRQEIANLANKITNGSKVKEFREILDCNISLCAYLFKNGYIKYDEIYFLSTSLIVAEDNRPDYICGCYHKKTGMSWYAIVCAGPQEQTWSDDLQLTPVAKRSFDRLNYCTGNLARILQSNRLAENVSPDRIHGLLIIGQDREFFKHPKKQERKRDINQNSSVKLRTYGAFLRRHQRKDRGWLIDSINNFVDRFKKIAR